jgi:zinc transport system substrate-binding protein
MLDSGRMPGRARTPLLLWRVWLALLLLAAPPVKAQGAKKDPLVVASFLPAYCAAVNVAGDPALVRCLVSGNLEPHDYQLTPADARTLAEADLVVVNGLGMESWLAKHLRSTRAAENGKLVQLTEGLDSQLLDSEGKPCAHGHEHDDGHAHDHPLPNPHTWLDPSLMEHGVREVVKGFIRVAPGQQARWESNGEAYIAKLRQLDQEFRAAAANLKHRPFVTHHNAFPYLARRYGLRQVGVVETSPDSPPGPRDLAALHTTIRREKVVAIFAEIQSPGRLPERISKDAGIRLGALDTLETGTADAGAYERGMRANLDALLRSLK